MKLTHNAIIAFKNKKQVLTKENIEEIKSDIELFQRSDISINELVAKVKIIISQFNTSTKTFELSYQTAIVGLPFLNDKENLDFQYVQLLKEAPNKQNIIQAKQKLDFQYREK